MNELYRLGCIPLYWNSPEYANKHGESEKWKESVLLSDDLKMKIDSPMGIEAQRDMKELQTYVSGLIRLYGLERMIYLFAVTIQKNPSDGRYGPAAREWAAQFDFSSMLGEHYDVQRHALKAHPTTLNRAIPMLAEVQRSLDMTEAVMRGRPLYQVIVAEAKMAMAEATDPEEDEFTR